MSCVEYLRRQLCHCRNGRTPEHIPKPHNPTTGTDGGFLIFWCFSHTCFYLFIYFLLNPQGHTSSKMTCSGSFFSPFFLRIYYFSFPPDKKGYRCLLNRTLSNTARICLSEFSQELFSLQDYSCLFKWRKPFDTNGWEVPHGTDAHTEPCMLIVIFVTCH